MKDEERYLGETILKMYYSDVRGAEIPHLTSKNGFLDVAFQEHNKS